MVLRLMEAGGNMHCCGNDDKIYVMKPVVVLERNKDLDRISKKYAAQLRRRKYFSEKMILRKRPARSKNVKNIVPPSDCSSTAHIKTGNYQKNIRKTSSVENIVSEATNYPQQSASCTNDSGIGAAPSEQVSEKRSIEEERPYSCSQCGDRFHTNILLAVHKRIHNDAEEDSGDLDKSANIHNVILDSRCTNSSVTASLVLEESNLGQNFENEDPLSSVPKENNSRETIQMHQTDLDKDPSCTASSVPEKEYKMYHRDHDYALSADKNPELKRKPDKKGKETNKQIKKRPARSRELFTCNQCPASFSRSWYLQLHMILLHYIHGKNTLIDCPGCNTQWEKEDLLRQHIETGHFLDLAIMNGELSSALRVPTDALTGENKKYMKKKVSSDGCPARPISVRTDRIACDWKLATSSEQDEIMYLVETELRHILRERNKLGDHFTHSDIQRLGLEIAENLRVSHFLYNNPSKRWAQKIISSVGQIPRPGKFRFTHNVNASYLNAVTSLSTRGLSESTVFYAFELNVCSVQENQIVLGAEVASNYQDDTVSAILSTNADGSVLLHPTFIYRGHIIDYKNIHGTDLPAIKTPPTDFFETACFRPWFAQFLNSIPKTRPVLLLVEGDVSRLSYSIILMARENDVHIVFLPNLKRFVHAHQLIRKSLVSPLLDCFESETARLMVSNNSQSVRLEHFGSIFDSAWKVTLQKAEISLSFMQSGFLPLPLTTRPLEEAAREYLDVVLSSKGSTSEKNQTPTETQADVSSKGSTSEKNRTPTETQADDVSSKGSKSEKNRPPTETEGDDGTLVPLIKSKTCTVSEGPSLARQQRNVKLESIEDTPTCVSSDSSPLPLNVKMEPTEELILPESDAPIHSTLEVKQEPIDYNIPDEVPVIDGLEELKIEYNCANCNESFHSNNEMNMHICAEDNNYSCPISDVEFSEEDTLSNHNWNQNLSNSVECDLHTCHICNMSFALKDTLDFHLTTHENNSQQSLDLSRHQLELLSLDSSSTVTLMHLSRISTSQKRVVNDSEIITDPGFAPKVPKLVSFELHDMDPSKQVDSPVSSSRTVSPTSSASSRTLTASPSDTWASDDEGFVKKNAVKRNSNFAKMYQDPDQYYQKSVPKGKLVPPPLPPLPEHDYLGQVYMYKKGKSKHTSPVSSLKKSNVSDEGNSRITISSLISSSHTQSGVLSRKQTRKVIRRIQLVCAESRLVKRLKK